MTDITKVRATTTLTGAAKGKLISRYARGQCSSTWFIGWKVQSPKQTKNVHITVNNACLEQDSRPTQIREVTQEEIEAFPADTAYTWED